jgi:hypothetical protein
MDPPQYGGILANGENAGGGGGGGASIGDTVGVAATAGNGSVSLEWEVVYATEGSPFVPAVGGADFEVAKGDSLTVLDVQRVASDEGARVSRPGYVASTPFATGSEPRPDDPVHNLERALFQVAVLARCLTCTFSNARMAASISAAP